jgi:DNA-binding NarL/FixJ family response regulator
VRVKGPMIAGAPRARARVGVSEPRDVRGYLPAAAHRASLLVAEDAPTRAGIRYVLAGQRFEICAEVSDAVAAVRAALHLRPDLCMIGAEIPGGGLRASLEIVAALPETSILILTGEATSQELLSAVHAGARGYLAKDASPDRLALVLDRMLSGEPALPRGLMWSLLDELRATDGQPPFEPSATVALTPRQRQVLALLGEGCCTSEIAHRLLISQVTVRRHISQIMMKLGVANRAGAAVFARVCGAETPAVRPLFTDG